MPVGPASLRTWSPQDERPLTDGRPAWSSCFMPQPWSWTGQDETRRGTTRDARPGSLAGTLPRLRRPCCELRARLGCPAGKSAWYDTAGAEIVMMQRVETTGVRCSVQCSVQCRGSLTDNRAGARWVACIAGAMSCLPTGTLAFASKFCPI